MKVKDHLYAVILAGGSGTRFWPLSRENYSKQFLKIAGSRSLLEQTVQRLRGLVAPQRIYIVVAEKDLPNLRLLFPDTGRRKDASPHILVEPEAKNTAPAIGLAAIHLLSEDPDSVMLVLPSDHLVTRASAFRKLVRNAVKELVRGSLLTLGVKPSRPETGYGYIQVGRKNSHGIYPVSRFVEKPDTRAARRYLKARNYFWNSGIFIWRSDVLLNEIGRHLPGLHRHLSLIRNSGGKSNENRTIQQTYQKIKPVSIDYGVMEKSTSVQMIPADIGWTDLGSWPSLEQVIRTDRSGNIKSGNVIDRDSHNSILYGGQRLVATIGLDEMIVVDSPDATLVCPKDRAQDIRQLVHTLKKKGAVEQSVHQTVERPWGSYTVMEEGPGYKVKRIVVQPGKKLSLQFHKHRSEHWVVTSGKARMTCGDVVYDVGPNESAYVPVGVFHRIQNPGKKSLCIIEVQCGPYLGEDDIVRISDDYGRQ